VPVAGYGDHGNDEPQRGVHYEAIGPKGTPVRARGPRINVLAERLTCMSIATSRLPVRS